MVRSMTGYGRHELTASGKRLVVEMKSVNHRFAEFAIRLPRQYVLFEDRIRKILGEQISRGRVDIYVSVENCGEKKRQVKVDKDLAIAYYNSLKELAEKMEIPAQIDVSEICRFPEVLTVEDSEENPEELWPALEETARAAMNQLVAMRETEGRRLVEDLIHRNERIAQFIREIADRAPHVTVDYREKLRARLADILAEIPVDEARLATEVAFFADRSSIDEEITRLSSHLIQMMDSLQGGDSVGRKLDFLVQELNREANTIGSKANDLEISRLAIATKSEIEKIREQVQNLE